MNLIDLRESDGPFWAVYQEERAREGIVDNPDFVPDWFLIKLMKGRLAAARVALEHVQGTREPVPYYEMKRAWQAIHTLESFLDYGSQADPFGARQQVLAGLLGAQEVETARELRWARLEGEDGENRRHAQEALREVETVEVERCTGAVWPMIWESGPEQCAYPVGHEGECAP